MLGTSVGAAACLLLPQRLRGVAIRTNQGQSRALRTNQKRSRAVRTNHSRPEALRGDQCKEVCKGGAGKEVYKGEAPPSRCSPQRSDDVAATWAKRLAIERVHQWQSVAISGSHLGEAVGHRESPFGARRVLLGAPQLTCNQKQSEAIRSNQKRLGLRLLACAMSEELRGVLSELAVAIAWPSKAITWPSKGHHVAPSCAHHDAILCPSLPPSRGHRMAPSSGYNQASSSGAIKRYNQASSSGTIKRPLRGQRRLRTFPQRARLASGARLGERCPHAHRVQRVPAVGSNEAPSEAIACSACSRWEHAQPTAATAAASSTQQPPAVAALTRPRAAPRSSPPPCPRRWRSPG